VEELERRVAALTARRDAVQARVRRRERADDLRRKVLVGACVLARWPDGGMPDDWRRVLDGYLTRPHDRRLFGLDGQGNDNRRAAGAIRRLDAAAS
jgi:hypothetical protein